MAAFTVPGAIAPLVSSNPRIKNPKFVHTKPYNAVSIAKAATRNAAGANTSSHSFRASQSQTNSIVKHNTSVNTNTNTNKNLGAKTLIISSSAGIILFLLNPLRGGGGNNNGGGGGGGGNGGGGGGGGGSSWWSRLFSASAIADDNDDNSSSEGWDPHGLPANIVVQLNKLSGFKKYKVSDILFFDQRRRTTVGTEDSFAEMLSLRPGGVYTKAQLSKELETLATSGMFEKVDLEAKTNADGSIKISVNFFESTWEAAEKLR